VYKNEAKTELKDGKYSFNFQGKIIQKNWKLTKLTVPGRMFDNFRDRLQTVQHDLSQG